jgi:hypothetical protein
MPRKLPEDPSKRRYQIFKRIYQNLSHWQALMEDRGMEPIITDGVTGEDIYIGDLMIGLDSLPPRQRQAFELICLRGYTETAARDELLPHSKSSTPVQQYADSGLVRMVNAYDAYQNGLWPGNWRKIVTNLHPLVRQHLESARKEIIAQLTGMQQALQQVEALLSGKPPAIPPPRPTNTPAATPPKPRLEDVAKEATAEALASAG